MIYTHVVKDLRVPVTSPLDCLLLGKRYKNVAISFIQDLVLPAQNGELKGITGNFAVLYTSTGVKHLVIGVFVGHKKRG